MAKFISKLIPAGDNVNVYYLKDKIVRDSIGVASGTSIGTGVTSLGIASLGNDGKIPTSLLPSSIVTPDALVYKGIIAGGSTGSYGALTTAADKGDVYKVTAAGKINGVTVEVGDMLICNTDDTAAATSSTYTTIASNWDIIQTNIDGAVTGPSSSVNSHIATFDGTTGKVIKDSGYTIATSVPSNAVFTDTTYSSKTAASGGTDVSLVTTGEKYTWNNKVSDVTYNSSTGKLQKTINGTTSDVVSIVNSGFNISYNTTTGLKTISSIGSATVAHNTTTGITAFTF